MSKWINVADELPVIGELVLVYRPNVLQDDFTDRPIRCATWNGKRFDCFHQPLMWSKIEKPDTWNQELEERQNS